MYHITVINYHALIYLTLNIQMTIELHKFPRQYSTESEQFLIHSTQPGCYDTLKLSSGGIRGTSTF